jgi:sec-independent protein translocase protein TatB
MFDFSFSELMVVGAVGLVVLGPEELPAVIRSCKKIINQIKEMGKEFSDSISEIDEVHDLKAEAKKLNDDLRTIIDLEGKPQQTYDISDIMPDIEKHNKISK